MSDFYNRKELFTASTLDLSEGTNAEKFYSTTTNELDTLKANYDLLSNLISVDYCTSALLDQLAANIGTSRLAGETDEELKNKITLSALSKLSSGTAPELMAIVKAFDSINTYKFIENPIPLITKWNGQNKLNGKTALNARTKATFYVQRFLDDSDFENNSLPEFIKAARVSGVNGVLDYWILATGITHYFEPPLKWDGSVKMNGTTKLNMGIVYDSLVIDGEKKTYTSVSNYQYDNYKIYDSNNNIVKSDNKKIYYLNGIFAYLAVLEETEANDKSIKEIRFFMNGILNFKFVLPVAINKTREMRLQFYELNQ